MQTLHQRGIFRFRVQNFHLIGSQQEAVGDLTLGAERFTGTRCAENQAIGVFQQLAVHHDKVVGQGIDAIVQRFFTVLE